MSNSVDASLTAPARSRADASSVGNGWSRAVRGATALEIRCGRSSSATYCAVLAGSTGEGDTGKSRYQLAVTLCERCGESFQQAGASDVRLEPAVAEMVQCDAQVVQSRTHVGGETIHCNAQVVEHRTHEAQEMQETLGSDARSSTKPTWVWIGAARRRPLPPLCGARC